MSTARRPIPKFLLAFAVLLASLITPHTLAQTSASPPLWEETIFLGESVPLRREGQPLADLARQLFSSAGGELTLSWTSPRGSLPLDELGREKPTQDQDYLLTAALRGPDGVVRHKELVYRVQVVTGTVTVRVQGEAAPASETASSGMLFCLSGQGLTIYRQALPDPDPQSGQPVLTAQFTGLPYGIYTVSAMGGGDGEQLCRLGVCQEDDTVDPARRSAVLFFAAGPGTTHTVGESFRLRVRQ